MTQKMMTFLPFLLKAGKAMAVVECNFLFQHLLSQRTHRTTLIRGRGRRKEEGKKSFPGLGVNKACKKEEMEFIPSREFILLLPSRKGGGGGGEKGGCLA